MLFCIAILCVAYYLIKNKIIVEMLEAYPNSNNKMALNSLKRKSHICNRFYLFSYFATTKNPHQTKKKKKDNLQLEKRLKCSHTRPSVYLPPGLRRPHWECLITSSCLPVKQFVCVWGRCTECLSCRFPVRSECDL